MLDINFIRKNPQAVQKGSEDKNFPVDISLILKLDNEIRPKQQELENLLAKRNKISKAIPTLSPEDRQKSVKDVQIIKKNIELLSDEIREKKEKLNSLLLCVAQPAANDVPVGKSDAENKEISRWGDVKELPFKAKDHLELGTKLNMIDIKRGVKISGARSYILKNSGALLEQALMRFSYDYLVSKGFTPLSVPVLVNEDAMEGTGYFPLGKEQSYFIEKDKLALVGTSEVSMCSSFRDETLDHKSLPMRLMSQSTCFRREAGTYGKDTKGLYRVHQFQKIEMVMFGHADIEQSKELHNELLSHAEYILQSLELPYRKVYVCTGDLGQGQVRKHDLEAWMPSRNSYGETHSCSTFYDFQTRRLGIRYKDINDGKKHFAFTLNNTACASPRILIPLMENHQTKEGHIKIPTCLQKYMNNKTLITG
jgi:seryl-tRNA synthetase